MSSDMLIVKLAVICFTACVALADNNTDSSCDCNAVYSDLQALKHTICSDIGILESREAEREKRSKAEMEALKARIAKMEEMLLNTVTPRRMKRFLADVTTPTPTTPPGQVPSFSARIGEHHLTQLSINQPIVLDLVLSNVGDHYSDTTGIFTAPSDGMYLFTGSIVSHSADGVETGITVNGNLNIALLYARDSHDHDQGSNTAIVHLITGDQVWMHLNGQAGNKVFGFGWSSFSGFRISD